MRTIHDPEHFSEDPDEQRAKEIGNIFARAKAEESYKDITENPELLRLIDKWGWTVATQKDNDGQIRSIEVRDAHGRIQFYEDIKEMERLKSETREN
jgi:hypothetical protein